MLERHIIMSFCSPNLHFGQMQIAVYPKCGRLIQNLLSVLKTENIES